MSEVLGKVTTRTLDVPRGPDVVHRIRVARAWLETGEAVEFELPRNLSCASCDGGGCDVCERAGAITLRGRDDLPELVTVTLPARALEAANDPRGVVIRIPERGGLAREGSLLPRGLLLLRVEGADSPDRGVLRVAPPAPALSEHVAHSLRVAEQARSLVLWLAVLLCLGLALLAFFELRGLG